MRFALIATEKACYPVALLCRVLKVSRSGYYAWHKRPAAARTLKDQALALEVAAIHAQSRSRYGSPRVHAELRQRGQRIARKRVARLMRAAGLRARRRFRCTTDSKHTMAIKRNLLARRFAVRAPNTSWATDITYLWTAEGWLYLAVILDLFSRRVVGWSLSERLERKLVLEALTMGLAQRQPARRLLHHSDRGSQLRQPGISATAGAPRHPQQHEPQSQLLGQCGGRELLRLAQTRTGLPNSVAHTRRGPQRGLRIHRTVLQPPAKAFGARLSVS